MKVILQKDVKDVGKVGELVNVSQGFARNFLFPRKLASEATENRVKEYEHLKRVAEVKKKKVVAERQAVLSKINGVSVKFKMAAAESDKIFGSVTTADVSKELEKLGHSVDRRDIHLEDQIKVLGNHKATVKLGEGLEASIQIVVERA
jgi:large subunit ribosomal protein L9